MDTTARRAWHRVGRLVGMVVAGVTVGALSGTLATLAHLWAPTMAGRRWQLGLVLAIGFVVVVDAALLSAVPRAGIALADAAGRALVVVAVLPRGPGGDMILQGGWPSEVWLALSVLIPALAGPPLATMAAVHRIRAGNA